MKVKVILITTLIFFLSLEKGFSQSEDTNDSFEVNETKQSAISPFAHFDFSYGFPAGDLNRHVKNYLGIGGGLAMVVSNKWIYDLSFTYYWSDDVYNIDGIFGDLLTSNGNIIASDGGFAGLDLSAQSYSIVAKIGRIIIPTKKESNNGFYMKLGAGYSGSFINIKTESSEVPGLRDDYAKLYDKYRAGILTHQAIGYMYHSESSLVNYFIEFEANEMFTKDIRKYDPVLRTKNDKLYNDLYFGIKIGWIFTWKRKVKDFYYY
ncbi:MAG: hypothetical protein ACEPOV_11910 [Hyphomicrobiales bacterium]